MSPHEPDASPSRAAATSVRTGLSLLTRRAAAPEPKVLLDHFDGTHMGVGVSLWRSRVTGDAGLRQLVVDVVSPEEALHSVAEIAVGMFLLLTQLTNLNAVPCARRFIEATDGLDEAQQMFVREIAQAIDDDQNAAAALISVVPVDVVTDVVAHLAEHLERVHGITVERQLAAHVEHLTATA